MWNSIIFYNYLQIQTISVKTPTVFFFRIILCCHYTIMNLTESYPKSPLWCIFPVHQFRSREGLFLLSDTRGQSASMHRWPLPPLLGPRLDTRSVLGYLHQKARWQTRNKWVILFPIPFSEQPCLGNMKVVVASKKLYILLKFILYLAWK